MISRMERDNETGLIGPAYPGVIMRSASRPLKQTLCPLGACNAMITNQPEPHAPITREPIWKRAARKVTTKEWMARRLQLRISLSPPVSVRQGSVRKAPPFYSLKADLPSYSPSYAVSRASGTRLMSGFQHSLAMLAGVITPPIIFASQLGFAQDYQSYLISASLFASGILSMVQMSRIKIPQDAILHRHRSHYRRRHLLCQLVHRICHLQRPVRR